MSYLIANKQQDPPLRVLLSLTQLQMSAYGA
jgi:hypothetical protein